MNRLFSLAISLVFPPLLSATLANELPEHSTIPQIVVILTLDGGKASYLDDKKADIPNLRALMAQGARAREMRVSEPSVQTNSIWR